MRASLVVELTLVSIFGTTMARCHVRWRTRPRGSRDTRAGAIAVENIKVHKEVTRMTSHGTHRGSVRELGGNAETSSILRHGGHNVIMAVVCTVTRR